MSRVKINPPDPNNPMALPTLDVSGVTRKWLNVDYTPAKPHPARKLDIFLPEEGEGPFPTIIAIHGGAFWGGAKDDVQVAAYLEGLDEGFAVVSVEQRLCAMQPDRTYSPEGLFPNPVCDYKAAIRFLRANAETYKLDPTRFATAGGSAGGYHAIMAAASADIPALYDDSLGYADVDGRVQAVVDWFGVGDLVVQSQYTEDTPMKLPDGTSFKLDNYADIFLGVDCRAHRIWRILPIRKAGLPRRCRLCCCSMVLPMRSFQSPARATSRPKLRRSVEKTACSLRNLKAMHMAICAFPHRKT